MAKITTGDIDILASYYQFRTATDDIFWYSDQLIRELLDEQQVGLVRTGNDATIAFESGNVMVLSGDVAGDNREKWSVSKLVYQTPNGIDLVVQGKIRFQDDGDFSLSSIIKSVDVIDPNNLVLDSYAQPLSAGLAGAYRLFSQNDRLEYEVRAQSKHAVLRSGEKFELLGLTVYNTTTYRESQFLDKVRLSDRDNRLLLELSDFKFTGSDEEEAALQSVESFVSYFLSGDDVITGTKGEDSLYSGAGNDKVAAGDGDDLIIGGDGAGNDFYNGGKGADTVKYTSAVAGITVNLARGSATSTAGNDAAGIGTDKLKAIENLIAGDYGDALIGSRLGNAIDGGAGNDTIDGGLGNDTLTGGAGADRFVFGAKPSTKNLDTVTDFETGIDQLVLSLKVFGKLKGITDLSDHFAVGSAGDANDFLVFDSVSGWLSYDADGNGKGKAIEVVLIGGDTQLQAADIAVI